MTAPRLPPPHGGRFRATVEWVLFRVPSFAPSPRNDLPERVFVLDGMRGWAALSVVGFHLWWETFGKVVPGYRNAVTATLLDGPLAVAVFFVLSGAALSTAYFAGKGRKSVVASAIKRYPRLVIPILAVSLLTTLLAVFDLPRNVPAGRIVDRADWLGSWLQTRPGIGQSVRFAFYDVFTTTSPSEELVPFLWSIKIELIGSMLTFLVLLTCDRFRTGWIIFGTIFVALATVYLWRSQTCGHLACFLAGVALSKARSAGLLRQAHASSLMTAATTGLVVALLVLDGIMNQRGLHPWRVPGIAMLLVPALLCNRYAHAFLDTGLSRFLGRISFPVFLVQFSVLVSFTSWMIVYAGPDRIASCSNIIAITSLALCIMLAMAFEPIENFSTTFGRLLIGSFRSRDVTAAAD